MKKSVAVVGGGIAGLTASYLLRDICAVTLYEKTGRIGGNAYTYRTRQGDDVDIAVAVFGRAGYKNFYRLLDRLNVSTSMCPTSYMSLHNLETKKGLYLTPLSLSGLVSQGFDMFRPSHLKALLNVQRGVARGMALLAGGRLEGRTLRDAIRDIPEFSGEALLLVMCALCLMSSMFYEEVMESPAQFFMEKLAVHHDVLSAQSVYSVRAVTKKTQAYVDALARGMEDRVILNARVRTILRDTKGVTIRRDSAPPAHYDAVVFACPADEALALLETPTPRERKLLGAWSYKDGTIVVHRDHSSFPPKELIQAYTFLYTAAGGTVHTSVNGGLWHEPGIRASCDYISSQHPNFPIRKDLKEFEKTFRTPIFDFSSYPTIRDLPSLNGVRNTYYCGSYFGFGLHEDAVTSAINAAAALGAQW